MNEVRPVDDSNKPVDMYAFYEKEIVKKRHNCTDVICLILFAVFLVIQVVLSVLIYVNGGDPKNIIMPRDSDGNLCTDSKPNLFYFNLAECINVNAFFTGCTSPTICVADCPADNHYYVIPSHRNTILSKFCRTSLLTSYFNGNVPSSTDLNTYTDLVTKKICPAYTLSSEPVLSRCLPAFLSNIINSTQNILATADNGTKFEITDLSNPLSYGTIEKGAKYVLELSNLKNIAQFILEDFVKSAVLIVVLIAIAAVLSFIYIIILRWILAPLIYFSIIILIALLAFALYFCISKYLSLKDNQVANIEFKADFNYYTSLSVTWLVAGIITGIILLLVLVLLLFLIKRIRLAIQLICESSKAVSSVFFTLLFPIIPLLLQIGFIAYFIANAVILACAGKTIFKVANSTNSSFQVGDTCSPTNLQGVQCVFYKYGFDSKSTINSVIEFLNKYQWIPQLYNLFMFFWVQAFIVGLNQMILAGCFGIWYWSKSKAPLILLTSIKDTFIYHLGSIAFGALLIAICKFLRTLIQIVEKRLKKATGNDSKLNCLISFVSCCCKCCLWCLEKFLKFINRNAYIMVAIYGKNFCRSARDALALIMSNPLRSLVLDRVTDFVLFIGRLLITASVGVLAFFFFSKGFYVDPRVAKYFAPDLHYYWIPLVAVIIGSYLIAKNFLTVFEMAVDTIFLCALKDMEINDGSPEKPYFMSTKLLEIMNLKNAKQKKKKKKRNKKKESEEQSEQDNTDRTKF